MTATAGDASSAPHAERPVVEGTTSSGHDHAAPRTGPQPYPVVRWLTLATFVVILNETLMINAIPRLMTEFDVTARTGQWLSTAFMLTMAVVIPVTGWLLQRVTTRQAFTLAMVAFGAGTLLAAAAPVFWVLVAGRVVQASGTAVMVPLLMTTLMTIVPEHDRGRVMGNVTLAISVAPALGPAVAGVVLQVADWRWLFLSMLPVVGAVAVVALRRLTNVGETGPGAIDVPSVLLATLGFGSLVYGLSGFGAVEQAAVSPWVLIGLGVLAVAVFAARQVQLQQRPSGPLLDLRTLTHRTFTLALALQGVAFLTMMGAMIMLPLYLQDLRGLSPLQTGLLVAPGGLAMGLAGPRVGRIFDRVGARPLMIPGSVLVTVGLAGLALLDRGTPYPVIVTWHLLVMVGLAMIMTPAFTISLGSLPMHLYSHGSSVLGTVQQVAAAVGTALTVTVLSARAASLVSGGSDPVTAYVAGFQAAFGVAAALALVTVAIALVLPGHATVRSEETVAPQT